MHWQRHKVGAAHWREMAERGEKMPVCIAIGARPGLDVLGARAAAANDRRVPLRRLPAPEARCSWRRRVTCDLEVPADAEFVIEGYIDPAEPLVTEGPFGDHTGFYSEADLYPQVHVTAITMRRTPVYATTIVGRPPMEDFYLGHATERIFLPLLQADDAGDRRLPHAGRGDLSQPRVRVDRQAVSGAGVQGDERDCGGRD